MITPLLKKVLIFIAICIGLSCSPLYGEEKNEQNALPPQTEKVEYTFNPLIAKVANQHQVDAALIKAIIMVESRYNPKAVSKQGAKGLMQLMPHTAQAFGVNDSFNPKQNIQGGVRYFKQLTTLYNGNIMLALAAYNAGAARVKRYKGIPPFKETRDYINAVLTYYSYYVD
ncbi:MAG: lytic transglycosylase domain-containing protein [Thermodesulfobacteriota bacterium]